MQRNVVSQRSERLRQQHANGISRDRNSNSNRARHNIKAGTRTRINRSGRSAIMFLKKMDQQYASFWVGRTPRTSF